MRKSTSTPAKTSWWILAALWFAACHLIITHNIWIDPLHRVPGPIGDNTVMLWNIGWVNYALDHGSPGFWFTNAYYPDGFLFLYGTPTWLDGFLYWLASPALPKGFTGAILWANISMVLASVLSGLAILLALCAWGVTSKPIRLLVTSAVVFSWFRIFASSGHYHFFGTHWLLLSLAAIAWARKAALDGNLPLFAKRGAAAGILLGITYLNDQAMTIFAAILGGLTLLSLVRIHPRHLLPAFALFYGCSLIVASIHLIPTIAALVTGKLDYTIDKSPRLVDATSLLLPPQWHSLGNLLQPLRETHHLTWSEGTYLGIIPALLLIIASAATLAHTIRRNKFHPKNTPNQNLKVAACACIAAWIFIICALGDKLVLGQKQIITLPGRLLKEIPVLNNIRLPQRWIWPAHLCIALSGALWLTHFLSRKKTHNPRQKWPVIVLSLLAIVPLLDALMLPPKPPLDYATDDYLHPKPLVAEIRKNYKSGSVLLMPAQKAYGHANIFQFILGYDVPMAITYNARMPFKPAEFTWAHPTWTPEAGEWLRQKNVTILAFPYDDGSPEAYAPWITHAKAAIPNLIILDRAGNHL